MLTQAVPLGQARKIAQRCGDLQKLPHREDAPLAGVGNNAAHLVHAAKAGAAVFDKQCIDGIGLGQVVALILHGGGRLQRLHHLLRLLTGAELHGPGKDLVQFQCCFIGGIHTGSWSPYSSTVLRKSRLFSPCSRWASVYCSLVRESSFRLSGEILKPNSFLSSARQIWRRA